jgi:hypothetical protein
MILLFSLLISLPTHFDQAQHDLTELRIGNELRVDKDAIELMWRPSRKLVREYEKAYGCYVRFHLYRERDCDPELIKVADRLRAEKE